MTTVMISCPFCIHLHQENRDLPTCDAFPGGIPSVIVFGEMHHTEPYPGDNGIRFDPRPGFENLTEEFERLDESRREGNSNAVVNP